MYLQLTSEDEPDQGSYSNNDSTDYIALERNGQMRLPLAANDEPIK